MAIVLKPFRTVNRRFAEGAEVTATDDLAPHSFAGLVAGGFIAGAAPAKPAPDKLPASRSRFRK